MIKYLIHNEFSQIFIFLKLIMKRKIGLITISIIIIFLVVIAFYTSYSPSSAKKIEVASTETSTSITSLPEIIEETTASETSSIPSTTAAAEISETTENINKDFPTLKINIYEGPVIIQDSDMCYYRVEAIVTGNPFPSVKFSKDDSNGAWGKYKAQVNLKNGEIYNLTVSAINSAGVVTKHIVLTWNQ
jgi:hypothetical protein